MLTFTVVSRHENRLCRLHVFNLRYIIYTLYVVACQYRKTGVCMCVSGGEKRGYEVQNINSTQQGGLVEAGFVLVISWSIYIYIYIAYVAYQH